MTAFSFAAPDLPRLRFNAGLVDSGSFEPFSEQTWGGALDREYSDILSFFFN